MHAHTPIGQCKCFRKSVGPADVREFEDVLFRKFVAMDLDHTPSPQSISGFIGLMVSQSWLVCMLLVFLRYKAFFCTGAKYFIVGMAGHTIIVHI